MMVPEKPEQPVEAVQRMGSRASKSKKEPQKAKVQLRRSNDNSRADSQDFANVNGDVHDYLNHCMKNDENSYASTSDQT